MKVQYVKTRADGPITVDELSSYIKAAVTSSPMLRDVAIKGELQSFKRHTSGHVYFTLVGEESRISGVMFRSSAANVLSWPADGDEVMVTGSVDVYPKTGVYQLYVSRMIPLGLGAQMRAKEELKKRLEGEGVFDPRRKRALPRYPSKVAVVTSSTGAALQDILKVSQKRAPSIDIIVVPALVQGVDAPLSIIRAIALASRAQCADVVILARGGGDRDDLAPFDDEAVVRAVGNCPIPIITGVGHEIDQTLVDLAADRSASTPSAAAEIVFPDHEEIRGVLQSISEMMMSRTLRILDSSSNEICMINAKLATLMNDRISSNEADLERIYGSLNISITNELALASEKLSSLASRLDAMSPLAVLSRGFSMCTTINGDVLASVDEIADGDEIRVRLRDGRILAEVLESERA